MTRFLHNVGLWNIYKSLRQVAGKYSISVPHQGLSPYVVSLKNTILEIYYHTCKRYSGRVEIIFILWNN